jgi:hypothetical protein
MDGYQIPLYFHNGLPYLQCRPPTADKDATLPHIIMTSDFDWDPTTYDNIIDDMSHFYDAEEDNVHLSPFDGSRQYRRRTDATHSFNGEHQFLDAYEYPDYDELIDDILDSHHQYLVQDNYKVLQLNTNLQKFIMLCYVHFLPGPQRKPYNVLLRSLLNFLEAAFRTPFDIIGVLDSPHVVFVVVMRLLPLTLYLVTHQKFIVGLPQLNSSLSVSHSLQTCMTLRQTKSLKHP